MKNKFNAGRTLVVLFLVFLCFDQRAQIICTDVNPDQVNTGNNTQDIDLNNDATIDFRITSIYASVPGTTVSGVFFQAGQVGVNNSVLTSGTGSVLALPLNTPIGPASTTWSLMNSTNPQMLQVINGVGTGSWAGMNDMYVGLKLVVGANTYFGWARFSFSSTSNTYTFKDYAYNSTPNQPILAGQGCGSLSSPSFFLNTSLCSGNTVTVSANTGTGTASTYTWLALPFGPVFSNSVAATTNISFPTAGTYTIALIVTSGTIIGLAQNSVVVSAGPTVAVTPSLNLCSNQTLSLNATASGATGFLWSGPASFTSSLQNPAIGGAASGVYTVTVTNAANCTVSAVSNVTMVTAPIPMITSNSPLCQGKDLQLNGTGGGTYAWSGPAGFSSSTQTSFVMNTDLASGGLYTLTVVSGPCTVSVSHSVTIHPLPVFTLSSNSPVCATKTLNLSAAASGASSFLWLGPNSFTSSLQNISFANATTSISGTYSFMATSAQGCTASAAQAVVVNSLPPLLILSNTTVCEKNNANFSAANVPNAVSYLWQGPSGFTSSQPTFSLTPVQQQHAGNYTLTITDVNSCQGSTTFSLTVLAAPSVSLSTSSASVCANTSVTLTGQGAATYSWSNGQTGQAITVNMTANTIFTVEGTNSAGCMNTATLSQVVIICTGLAELKDLEAEFSIFPNPTAGILQLKAVKAGPVLMEIVDNTGRIIMHKEILFSEAELTQNLSLTEIKAGVYFLKVRTGEGRSETIKLLKE